MSERNERISKLESALKKLIIVYEKHKELPEGLLGSWDYDTKEEKLEKEKKYLMKYGLE